MPRKATKTAGKLARETAYRSLVLDAAERVFAKRDYESTKIKEIADEAGIALGTVYAVFESKHEIFRGVHERRAEELLPSVLEALGRSDDPFDAIDASLGVLTAFYAEHPTYLRMHLKDGKSWAIGPENEIEANVYHQALGPIGELLQRAHDRGELVDLSPASCARLLLAMLQVFMHEWTAERFATPPDVMAARIGRTTRHAFSKRGAAP